METLFLVTRTICSSVGVMYAPQVHCTSMQCTYPILSHPIGSDLDYCVLPFCQSYSPIRVNAEARSNTGQSLLSIATQNNDAAMVEFLLTHWKSCDAER